MKIGIISVPFHTRTQEYCIHHDINSTVQKGLTEITSMERMYSNINNLERYFGDISQLTNWILESVANFPMTSHISNFVLGSVVETEKINLSCRWALSHSKNKGKPK